MRDGCFMHSKQSKAGPFIKAHTVKGSCMIQNMVSACKSQVPVNKSATITSDWLKSPDTHHLVLSQLLFKADLKTFKLILCQRWCPWSDSEGEVQLAMVILENLWWTFCNVSDREHFGDGKSHPVPSQIAVIRQQSNVLWNASIFPPHPLPYFISPGLKVTDTSKVKVMSWVFQFRLKPFLTHRWRGEKKPLELFLSISLLLNFKHFYSKSVLKTELNIC